MNITYTKRKVDEAYSEKDNEFYWVQTFIASSSGHDSVAPFLNCKLYLGMGGFRTFFTTRVSNHSTSLAKIPGRTIRAS